MDLLSVNKVCQENGIQFVNIRLDIADVSLVGRIASLRWSIIVCREIENVEINIRILSLEEPLDRFGGIRELRDERIQHDAELVPLSARF